MDEYVSRYEGDEIDEGISIAKGCIKNIYDSIVLCFGIQYGGYTTSEITYPEFAHVLTDSEDKIIAGIKKDGSLYVPEL